MSLSIQNNTGAALASLSLDRTESAIQQDVQNISSGVRIHTSGDDPSGMAITSTMSSNIGGMQQATSNNEEGISLLQTAQSALDSISTALISMRGLVVDAANAALQTPDSLSALQNSLNQSISAITTTANNTQFGSKTLLNGSFDGDTVSTASRSVISGVSHSLPDLPGGIQPGSALTTTVGAPVTMNQSTVEVNLTGTTAPLPGSTPIQGLSQNGTVLGNATGNTYTVNGPLGSQAFTLASGTTIDDVVAEINAYTGRTGMAATYDPSSGNLTVASTSYGNSTCTITSQDMSGTGANIGLFDSDTTGVTPNSFITPAVNNTINLAYTDASGATQNVTLVQDPTSPGGLTYTNTAGGPEPQPPYSEFDPGAFSVTVANTSTGGVPSSFSVPAGTYTATRQTQTVIQTGGHTGQTTIIDIPDMRAGALGHTAGLASSGFASLQDLVANSALTNGDSTQALAVIDAAINEVDAVNANLGAIQTDSLQSALTALQTSSASLTNARGQILDTDMATATADYSSKTIIYQAATAMISQANQEPQTVLQLLKGGSSG